MDLQLRQEQFVDNRYTVEYGANKQATFIVVNESFGGKNNLGVVNRINIFTESFNGEGEKIEANFSTSVIGIGDMIAGIFPADENDIELLGKIFNWDNMERCLVRLYE
jgi:hypothetical protein